MTTFAVVRQSVDHWGDPILLLVGEEPTQDRAEKLARECLPTWPDVTVECWVDSYAERLPDGRKRWRKSQSTSTVMTFQEVG